MKQEKFLDVFIGMQQKLQAVGISILKYPDKVSDAIQDTFCKLWQKSDMLRENDAENLIFITMRNQCIDDMRRKSNIEFSLNETIANEQVIDESQNCDFDHIYNCITAIIDKELTPLQRKIMIMRDVEGQSYKNIASVLQLEKTAVRMHVSRARKLVRTIYLKRKEIL